MLLEIFKSINNIYCIFPYNKETDGTEENFTLINEDYSDMTQLFKNGFYTAQLMV